MEKELQKELVAEFFEKRSDGYTYSGKIVKVSDDWWLILPYNTEDGTIDNDMPWALDFLQYCAALGISAIVGDFKVFGDTDKELAKYKGNVSVKVSF